MQRTQAPAQGLRWVAPAWDACAPIFVRQLQVLELICLIMTCLLAPSNAIPCVRLGEPGSLLPGFLPECREGFGEAIDQRDDEICGGRIADHDVRHG